MNFSLGTLSDGDDHADATRWRRFEAVLLAHGFQVGDPLIIARRDVDQPRAGGARRTDRGTSRAAAFDVMPRTGTHRQAALAAIMAADERGMTHSELIAATGVNGIWKRVSELQQGGWIKDVGRTRRGDAGSDQTVWFPTEKAIAAAMRQPSLDAG